MLVLSRKVGEKLVIADNIVVEIVRIRGNRITLGLVAPEDVKIVRGELKKHADKNEPKPMLKAC
jgi:carbon storage regulator